MGRTIRVHKREHMEKDEQSPCDFFALRDRGEPCQRNGGENTCDCAKKESSTVTRKETSTELNAGGKETIHHSLQMATSIAVRGGGIKARRATERTMTRP